MKTEIKEEKIKSSPQNYRNIKRVLLQEQNKESEIDKNQMNYFHIMKEIEKEQQANGHSKKDSKIEYNSLTEKIYSNNSAKLGNYYNQNQNDLLLYGSKKYDLYTIRTLVKEMDKYKNKVIKKIKQNKKSPNSCKNYEFESHDEKVILTPLAESEKEKNEMEKLEKKKFDEAERLGVVMRRIEYTHLLDHRDSFRNSLEEEKRLLLLMKNSVGTIEKNWLRYRNNKNILRNKNKIIKEEIENDDDNSNDKNTLTKKKNIEKGLNILNDYIKEHFYVELLGKDDIKKINKTKKRCFIYKIYKKFEDKKEQEEYIEELKNKYDVINKNYIEAKNKLNDMDLENKQLQLLLKSTKNNNNKLNSKNDEENDIDKHKKDNDTDSKNEENDELLQKYEDIINKYNEKIEEFSILNKNYNDLLSENNTLKNKYDELLKYYNSLDEKYKYAIDNNNNKDNELDNIKNEYENIIKINNENLQKINELQDIIEGINKEKNDCLNENKLLIDKITKLDGKVDSLQKAKTIQDEENENYLKQMNDKYMKEKENLSNDIYYFKHVIDEQEKQMDEQKNIIKKYKKENNELNKDKEDKENELKHMKLDLYKLKSENNVHKNEIYYLKKIMNNNDKINKVKTTEYEKEIDFLKNKINEVEKENENLKNISNNMKKLSRENKDKYEKLNDKYNNDVNELNEYIDNLKKEINNLEGKNNEETNNHNDLIEQNKIKEEKINYLNQIIDKLKNENKDLNNEIYNIRNKNNNINKISDFKNTNELKTELFYLLLQKFIDKNIIFDKRKFLNLLMEKKSKQNLRTLRVLNVENDRKYRTEDVSLRNIFKSKSKEKIIELLRSSFKRDHPY